MAAFTFSLLSALCLTLTITQISCYDANTRDYMIGLVRTHLAANSDHIAGFVRLIFHDCVGNACDGCVNLDQDDNNGLDVYIDALETIYQDDILSQGHVVTRADWWALAATEAIYLASCVRQRGECNTAPEILNLPFTTGRVDCPTSPSTTEEHQFPSALWGLGNVLLYFSDAFGLSPRQVVAVMGAHTLGSAHREASGFAGPWDQRPNRLDNQFYDDLLNKMDWAQEETRGRNNQKFFWERQEGTRRFIMLNSDMCLVKNLETAGSIGTTGDVSCTYDTCSPADEAVLDVVVEFASDESQFLIDFALAMRVIVEHGSTVSVVS